MESEEILAQTNNYRNFASIGASKHKYEEQMSIKPTFSVTKLDVNEEQFDNKFSAQKLQLVLLSLRMNSYTYVKRTIVQVMPSEPCV